MDERVQIYREITGFLPSCFQQDLILVRVSDLDKWRKAVIWWTGNGYRAQSVLKVIEYYEDMGKEKFGKPKVDMYIGANPNPVQIDEGFCPFCQRGECYTHGTTGAGAVQ